MYELMKLPYAYDALEPYIDARTMEIHHTKHHQAYVDGLNGVCREYPELAQYSLEELLQACARFPASAQVAVRNFGGGHDNHSRFWHWMRPGVNATVQLPQGIVMQALHGQFGSWEEFQSQFTVAAKSVFGSGWAWLVLDSEMKLRILTTPNQDSPLLQGLYPILGVDVWEHAYYLMYQNRRMDYVQAWWHVVNWEYVEHLYVQRRV